MEKITETITDADYPEPTATYSVKRYESAVMGSGGDYWPEMQESRSGEYVSLADYAALQAENARQQSIIDDANAQEISSHFVQWLNDFDDQRNATISKWLDEEGRALLNKLNDKPNIPNCSTLPIDGNALP